MNFNWLFRTQHVITSLYKTVSVTLLLFYLIKRRKPQDYHSDQRRSWYD